MIYLIAAGAVVVLFAVIVFVLSTLRRVVPTNMVHIVQSSNKTTSYGNSKPLGADGKATGPTAGNTYYFWPSWVPKLGITVTQFPESIFQLQLEQYEAYDTARLPFVVDVAAFFRLDHAETVSKRVANFHELETQLKSVLQGAVRRILATNTLEDILQARSTLGAQFTAEVEEQIKEWGIKTVKTIEFMDIRDSANSSVIANIMSKEKSRIDMDSRIVVAGNKRTAELTEIDTQREVAVQRQDAEQQVGLRTATRDQTVGIANEQAKQAVQEQTKVTTERLMEVRMVQETRTADIAKTVSITNAEAAKQTTVLNAEAAKEKLVIDAEGVKEAAAFSAEADLIIALKKAQGVEAEGKAQAAADEAIGIAAVTPQITLAKEIGENTSYQDYLLKTRQIDANKEVGIASADALKEADIKIISGGAQSGNLLDGVTGLNKLVSSSTGINVSGLLAGVAASSEGQALIQKFIGPAAE